MNHDELKDRLRRPTETLQIELKSWLDLEAILDRAKIARALIALRNRNGGVLIFGFDNKTLGPTEFGRPKDIRALYHSDTFQLLVKAHAEPPFPVSVEFVERDGLEFPVVVVPSGIKSPVIARQNIVSGDGEKLLRQNAVYVRSISNNVVQTTEPRSAQDWNELMEICFDNREADIGRFLRRHLGSVLKELDLTPSASKSVPVPINAADGASASQTPFSPANTPGQVLDEGTDRFASRVTYMRKQKPSVNIPDQRAWRETGVILTGPVRPLIGQHLMNAVFPRHPQLSGWPMWIDSRRVGGELEQPYPSDGGWEALVLMSSPAFVKGTMVDFWRIDPRGEFYHRRSLEDDLWPRIPDENRGTTFDIINGIKRVAEALATVQSFAQGMSENPETATLKAAFRWTNLRGRKLISIEPGRDFFAPTAAYQDMAESSVEMPISAAHGALASYVGQAVTPLFATFGYQVPSNVIDELTVKTLASHFR